MGNTYNPQTGKIDRVVSKLPSEKIIIDNNGTYKTLKDYINLTGSSGVFTGGVITDNLDGTITVSAGSGLFRKSASKTADLTSLDWQEVTRTLTDNAENYVIADYNNGLPTIAVSTTDTSNTYTTFLLANIYRSGSILHINDEVTPSLPQAIHQIIKRLIETEGITRESGAILGETGTRNISVTEGNFWEGLNEFSTSAFDSSVSDSFTYYYRDGAGGWTEVLAQTQIDNTNYDDGSGTLATLGVNRYSTAFVYVENDSDIAVIYGRGSYTLKEALDTQPSSDVPPQIVNHGVLIGRIIIQQGASSFEKIDSAFDISFTGAGITSHLDLTDIGVNTHLQIDSHIADSTIHFTEGSIDHGSIAGLADDDHTQYLLIDGTRAMSGNLNMDSNSITNILDATIFNNLTVLNAIGNSNNTQLFSHTGAGLRVTGLSKFPALGTLGNAEGVIIFKDSGATFLSSEEFFQIKDGETGSNLLGVSESATKVYNSLEALAGLDVTGDVKLDETKKIIFDSNATSTQFIQADSFLGIDIFRFKSAAVFNFDITSSIFQGRYDFQLGTNNNGQYFRVRNESGTALFQFYGDGTSRGLPFTFNGGHDGNLTGTTLVSWGANNADGPLVLPANCILNRVTIGLSKTATQGTFDLEYEINGPGTFGAVVTLVTFDATNPTGPDYNRDWKIVKNIGTTFNEGDRLRFRTNNNGSFAPTSGQQPIITLYFTTNE